jgi:hypothetical protein
MGTDELGRDSGAAGAVQEEVPNPRTPSQKHSLNRIGTLLPTLTRFLIFAVPAFAFALSIHQLKGGWDDGAITAAFARTLAESGRFALTPLSEKVEGFSSVTWVLLLTIPYYLFHTVTSILVWMKLLSALCFCGSLVIFKRLASSFLNDEGQASLATVLLALIVCPLLETLNGMEMNLYMLLALCLAYILIEEKTGRVRTLWIWLLTFALLATRFEAPYIVAALLAGLLLSRDRSRFFHLAAAVVASFGALELWRRYEFGVWMPNTVYAKMHPPYTLRGIGEMLNSRFSALLEIVFTLGAPLLVLLLVGAAILLWKVLPLPRAGERQRVPVGIVVIGVLLGACWFARDSFFNASDFSLNAALLGLGLEFIAIAMILHACLRSREHRAASLTAAMVAAGVAFGMLFGRNWGYDGRMILACIPFMVLGIACVLSRYIPSGYWSRLILLSCVLCQALIWVPKAESAWRYGFEIPISLFQNTGRDADAIRQLIHLDSLSILLPDMGGSSLCCEKLQIFDSALLTNSHLAHTGYAAFESYLQQINPQIIETHGPWSGLTGIYGNPVVNEYTLTVVDRSRLLLRNDIYAKTYERLQATTGVHFLYGRDCAKGILDPANRSLDDRFIASRERCLYISREDLIRNGVSLR